MSRFVADMTARHRAMPRKVIAKRTRAGGNVVSDAFAELVRRGWLVELARRRIAVRAPRGR